MVVCPHTACEALEAEATVRTADLGGLSGAVVLEDEHLTEATSVVGTEL